MKSKINIFLLLLCVAVIMVAAAWSPLPADQRISEINAPPPGRYLYVAVPGIRNYFGYGGHSLLVFDMNNNHRFVKRIKTQGLKKSGEPSNVKGVAVSVQLNSIYISTLEALQRIDLTTEKILQEKRYPGVCDRMSI